MRRIIASRTPVGYEQNTPAGVNWNGLEPSDVTLDAGIMGQGSFEVPADPANNGLFNFRHPYPVKAVEVQLVIGAGVSWTLDRVRHSGAIDQIATGGPGITRLTAENDELPVLNPGDNLRLTSTGAAGAVVCKATAYVEFYDLGAY